MRVCKLILCVMLSSSIAAACLHFLF